MTTNTEQASSVQTASLERLRGEKDEFECRMSIEGTALGRDCERLDYEALWRLSRLRADNQLDTSGENPASNLVEALGDGYEYHEFWQTTIGNADDVRLGSPEFVTGFVDGALEVFDAV